MGLRRLVEARQLVNQMAALTFTPEATRSVLEGVNPHKSAGPDGVHPCLVKILADVLVEPITALFNHMLVDGIPADWKKAEVIPLYKKGDNRSISPALFAKRKRG